MPPRRSADEGPVATIFMLVLLVGITVGGIWYSVREKTNGGVRPRDPDIASVGSVGRSRPRSGSPNSPEFVEAFKQLPNDATAMQRSAEEEFDNTARLLGADRADPGSGDHGSKWRIAG